MSKKNNIASTALARAYAAYEIDRLDLAEKCILEGLSVAPEDISLMSLHGFVKIGQKRFSHARSIASHILGLAPDIRDGYSILAWATLSDYQLLNSNFNGEIERVRDLVSRMTELDPTAPEVYILLAEVESMCDREVESLAATDKGLMYDADNEELMRSRARALRNLGRSAEAIRTHQHVLSRNPEDHKSHFRLAQIYLQQNQLELANQHSTTALQLVPTERKYRESYWESIKSKHWFLRPFVYWQFAVQRIERMSESRKYAVFSTITFCFVGLGLLFKFTTGRDTGIALSMITGVSLGLVLAWEKPFAAVTNSLMFYLYPEFRSAVDRQELLTEIGIFFAGVVAIMILVLLIVLYV